MQRYSESFCMPHARTRQKRAGMRQPDAYKANPQESSTYLGTMKRTVFSGSTI